MKNFLLNYNYGLNFNFLSFIYIILILITIFCLIKITKHQEIIRKIKNKKTIRISVGIFFLLVMIIRRLSFVFYGVYDWHHHLDINFCSMTNIIFVIYCFTGNVKIYKLCYYMIFSGPLMAILFPSVNVSINNYSFFCFVVMHHLIFIINYIFLIFNNIKFSKKDFIISYILIVLFVAFTYIFNAVYDTNYNTLSSFLSFRFSMIPFFHFIANNHILSNLSLVLINYIFLYIAIRVMKNTYSDSVC